jgi:SAM-dependent methyltransferase
MTISDWVTLGRLAIRRLDSPEAYLQFQQFQGELLSRLLLTHHVTLQGQSVLDLACGLGGYALALRDSGARVVGVDYDPPTELANIPLLKADALQLPLASETFDVVICASLIEHVPDPARLLEEVRRILRPGGMAYLSFPPFYTPIGGHQFSPFHLFGERLALRLFSLKHFYRDRRWLRERYPDTPRSFTEAFGGWGLYPLSIANVEALLRTAQFEIVERSTRWMPIDFSSWPILREFLTWHVQFLLRKSALPAVEG